MAGRGPRNYLNLEPVENDGSLQAKRAEFARRLQRVMMEKKWNQSDLARRAATFLPPHKRMGRDDISTYIRGLAMPRPDKLMAICQALGVDPSTLIPPGSTKSVADDARGPRKPKMEWNDDGSVWVSINQNLPSRLGLEIMAKVNDYNDPPKEKR